MQVSLMKTMKTYLIIISIENTIPNDSQILNELKLSGAWISGSDHFRLDCWLNICWTWLDTDQSGIGHYKHNKFHNRKLRTLWIRNNNNNNNDDSSEIIIGISGKFDKIKRIYLSSIIVRYFVQRKDVCDCIKSKTKKNMKTFSFHKIYKVLLIKHILSECFRNAFHRFFVSIVFFHSTTKNW